MKKKISTLPLLFQAILLALICLHRTTSNNVVHEKLKDERFAWVMSEKEDTIKEAFGEFIKNFDRKYKDSKEKEYRFGLFRENFKIVQELNKKALEKGVHASYSPINPFADWTREEKEMMAPKSAKMKKAEIGVNKPSKIKTVSRRTKRENLPDQYDMNEKGKVTPIRDQKSCGTCWAFAAAAAIESALLEAEVHNDPNTLDLSEQQIAACTNAESPKNKCQDGGSALKGIDYVRSHGVSFENEHKYEPKELLMQPESCTARENEVKQHFELFDGLDKRPLLTPEEMKRFVFEEGPIVTHFLIDELQMFNYKTDVNSNTSMFSAPDQILEPIEDCRDPSLNATAHAVVITGYGVSPEGKNYWIFKNSWGTGWGNAGFGHFIRGNNSCNFERDAYGVFIEEKTGKK